VFIYLFVFTDALWELRYGEYCWPSVKGRQYGVYHRNCWLSKYL